MTIPRGYVSNHKFWDRMGRITPNFEWSESHRPHFESTPASWLPTVRYEQEYETYYVVSSGKVVAEDREGKLVPAGLRKAWNIASGATALTYTTTDASEGVIDLVTGTTVVAAGVSYTRAELTAGLRERGLIRHTEHAMDFISRPIGFASYNYYKAAGTDHYNPANLIEHNFRPQALCAVTCDYVGTFPVLPALATTETMANDNTAGANGALEDFFDGTTTPRVAGWFNSTQIAEVTRYSGVTAGDSVVGYMFVNYPVAHITEDSPITSSLGGLTREVDSISSLSAAGDFFMDYEVGMLFVYEDGGDAIPSPFTVLGTITYYHYMAEGSATNTLSTYACATGNLDYGDFVTFDDHSNLIKAELNLAGGDGYDASGDPWAADPEYDTQTDNSIISNQIEQIVDNHVFGVVGQVIGTFTFGEGRWSKDYLDRVHTSYMGQTAANLQTPGTATGGRTDQLTYANAAERMIIVNLILR